MAVVKIANKTYIGGNNPCFIIAEVGQNHQGDIAIAKRLIMSASRAGADCVKFQKTCLDEKFTKAFLSRPYTGSNSWGATYGDHKTHLEFSKLQYEELQRFAKENRIHFTASAMDSVSFDFLMELGVPFVKIGSGDSNNLPLLRHAAAKRIPLVISTGMIDKEAVERVYSAVAEKHNQFCLLHCVSAYPTPYEDCNLSVIRDYRSSFDVPIGYSGHELGVATSTAAVALGAKVLERHITLDKTWRGTDHQCSLDPEEFKILVNNIRLVEAAMGVGMNEVTSDEELQKR